MNIENLNIIFKINLNDNIYYIIIGMILSLLLHHIYKYIKYKIF
jgi:hypothetical protein